MVSVTLSVSDEFKKEIKSFPWVNWSEIAKEEANKKRIFEEFLKTRKLSDEDWEFCEQIDWHPVDELPLKESFVKKLEERKKGPFIKLNSISEIFEK